MINAGDVVECVHDGAFHGWKEAKPWLQKGKIYRVALTMMRACPNKSMRQHIVCEGVRPPSPNCGAWVADRFRKLDKCDEGFKALLAICKPKKAKEKAPEKVPQREDARD